MLDLMQEHRLDAVVLGSTSHVYYCSGYWPFWQHQAAFVLFADGRSVLIAGKKPAAATAADEVVLFEASWMSTTRQEQPSVVASSVIAALKARQAAKAGFDACAVASQVELLWEGEMVAIDEDMFQLRRRKDPDELLIMRHAIDCTRAMYEKAREIIAPGIPELQVYGELHAVAVKTAGAPLSAYLGNDYACGAQGGPPRKDRVAQSGELYILDLGPAVDGYFSDNCRVVAVDHKLTDAQHKAWEMIMGVFPIVENLARPGVRCREIFSTVNDYYRSKTGKEFPHHLGHGVGLQPHEFPHLNPRWDDTLMEGEVFTCEPGIYGTELGGGIRLENQYLVTGNGIENLTPFPMEMA
jgi:Xaa-Pro dipeptidase